MGINGRPNADYAGRDKGRAGSLRRVPARRQLAVAVLIGGAAAGLAWAQTVAAAAVLVG